MAGVSPAQTANASGQGRNAMDTRNVLTEATRLLIFVEPSAKMWKVEVLPAPMANASRQDSNVMVELLIVMIRAMRHQKYVVSD